MKLSCISLIFLLSNLGILVPVFAVQIPYSLEYDSDYLYEWPSEEVLETYRTGRTMYLAQGVEFVFPIGVQYTLANVNEKLWPVDTSGFDTVLEFPKNKIAIMFSSMINTLKIANFTVTSRIYTPEVVPRTTALGILGTEVKSANFKSEYKDTWATINKDISDATSNSISEFIPRGGLYGRSIYPFTTATFVNTIHYENQWAFPWRDGIVDKFTDTPLVPFLEVEGLMPYYENEAFVAVAALFKGGTGSTVFLKPKGAITILQLMLNPTALTQIFDENFPGWSVKQMRVRVPKATFVTSSQHYDMLVKRGVTKTFCTQDNPTQNPDKQIYSLNPIVQTNHLKISKDKFSISSVTGVTLNSEKELLEWGARQRDDLAPETILEEYTTPPNEEVFNDDSEQTTTSDEVVVEDSTTVSSVESTNSVSGEQRSDTISESEESHTDQPENTSTAPSEPTAESAEKSDKKATAEIFSPVKELYEFNEPFLWFLHAINEEPMFMGVVESFKRYVEETGNRDNEIQGSSSSSKATSTVIEKNGWIYGAAKGVLWHCPSLINKQAE